MLQFIRSKAGSFVFKILFVLLIASFGIWGIGDFLRQRPEDTTVISVGDHKITGDELQAEAQREIDRSEGKLTLEQAKTLGLIDQMIENDVLEALLDQEAARLHIMVSDDQIREAVQRQPGFRGEDGKFSFVLFQQALEANGLSQGAYEASLRSGIPRSLLVDTALDGAAVPAVLADTLYQSRNEQRIADWVYLPNAGIKDVAAPDDKALHDFYDKHHDTYTAPEFRGYTLLALQHSDVAASVTVGDDKLHAAYQERLDSYTTPEKRHVLQLLAHDDKTKDAVEQALAAGKDFTQVARDIAKQDPDTIDLGTHAKSDFPAQIAGPAFAAGNGEVTKAAKGPFGWFILKVAEIEPGAVQPFDEVKAKIEADLRQTEEGEALYELQNKVQDAMSAGSDLAQIAEQFQLKTVTIPASDRKGDEPDGKPIAAIALSADQVTTTAFGTPQGQLSPLVEVGEGNAYFVLKLDKIVPSALVAFDHVAARVKDDWIADQRAQRTAEQAKALVDGIKPDLGLAKLAGAKKLQIATTPPFKRTNEGKQAPIPSALVAKLFTLQAGQAAAEAGPQGQYVAQLKEIKPADSAAASDDVDRLKTKLAQGTGQDLVREYEAALKERYPVEIHRDTIDKLFSSSPE